ncbi:MAG: trypsin-like peptidase domain-containing protein, partial [Planctomycetota bacterium]
LAAPAAGQTRIGPRSAAPDDARDVLYEDLKSEPRSTPVTRVVEASAPSVVFVETEALRSVPTVFGRTQRIQSGAGSGVVIHSGGYVVTNYHVVEGAQNIRVSFQGQPEPYPARLMSSVPEEDLALLLIEAPRRTRTAPRPSSGRGLAPTALEPVFPTVRLGTSADLMAGERVVAIGSPHGQAHSVSTGIISGLHRDVAVPTRRLQFSGLIQTDASINFGNSGGPLLNIHGELIGINTVMNTRAENIGFAIPVDRVRQVLEEELFPNALKVWLGVDVEERSGGLVVTRVWEGGPAASGEISEGDRIVSVGGHGVTSKESLDLQLIPLQPGAAVELALVSQGTPCEAKVETWDVLDGELFKDVGVAVDEQSFRGRRDTLLVVRHVRPDSPADDLGVLPGDLIPAMRPRTLGASPSLLISDRLSLKTLLDGLPQGTEIEVDAYRDANGDGSYDLDEQLKGVLVR